ncbi:MAG: ATP-binding cassette domain-containing protein [Alphaproteobacteria bacterium]|nr:ATP-binding cassette domain-containing protein [Alphaproteobacteria bacterium]MCB9698959.1 ATP-binding cassette domain-containing protein [Alphaproteobacteria bacterium]
MIRIDKVTRKYGDNVAVRDVSLTIQRGEIVGLLGHNGAGKTTLMKMLTGYLEPTSGTIAVGGADVVANRIEVQRQIGYLPENAPLYPEMLVQEYLLMMAELRGVPADRRPRAVALAAARTGLQQHLLRPIAQLSKGYRQRVGIAQAIVHEPALLVLDEPTNGLDPVQIQSIRDLIERLGKTSTIILSTHILQEVEAVCDRVLIMIDGQLSADAPLQQLLQSRTLRISVREGTDLKATLGGMDGVVAVRREGPDADNDGYVAWSVDLAEQSALGPNLLHTLQQKGLDLASFAPEHRTLEGVFKQLQREHVARQESAA